MLGTENLYTAAQARALDQCAICEHNIAGITLMARAADAALRYLLEVWPEPERLQVICGTGNNGGDGFLMADLAHKRGINVTVFQLGDLRKIAGDAALAIASPMSTWRPRTTLCVPAEQERPKCPSASAFCP